jgi:hypothetical protein
MRYGGTVVANYATAVALEGRADARTIADSGDADAPCSRQAAAIIGA